MTKAKIAACILSAVALASDCIGQGAVPGADGRWTGIQWRIDSSCSRWVNIANGILTVDVPAGVSNVCAYATAELDLSDLDRASLEVSIKARSSGINVYSRKARGFKVAVHYTDPQDHCRHYPYAAGFETRPFDWTDVGLSVSFGEVPPGKEDSARLVLGIQQGSGRAEFDLRTLVVKKTPPLYVMDDVDRTVSYSAKMSALPPLHGVMSRGALRNTEKDIDDLHKMGATLVRLQMNAFQSSVRSKKGGKPTMADWDRWFYRWIGHIDNVLDWLEARDMKMVLDMHNPPVGRDGVNIPVLVNPEFAARFVSAWEELARRYKGRKGIYGYDLINEPVQTVRSPENCDFWNLQRRAAEAIRAIDPEATIVVEAEKWDHPSAFRDLRALDMDNVVYSVHMYYPGWFTHQGSNGAPIPTREKRLHYPSVKGDRKICRNDLRDVLKPVRDFQLRHSCRILVGEFSAALYAPGAAEWLADVIDIFEEYGWDWTYHSFREARYWNVETVLDGRDRSIPGTDNPRYFVLTSGLKPSYPVEISQRDILLSGSGSAGRCEAVVRNVSGARCRFAALASVSFRDDAEIGNSVAMHVVWRRPDGTEIRRDTVAFRDFCENGHSFRAFEEVLDVPEGADGRVSAVIEASGRIGEVRVSAIRATALLKPCNPCQESCRGHLDAMSFSSHQTSRKETGR